MQKNQQLVHNYVLFEKIGTDSMGTLYRVGELENRKVTGHRLFTDVYPFISGIPKIWKRVNLLTEGVKQSHIPNLFYPERIIEEAERAYLVYPYIKGRSLTQILNDAPKKHIPLDVDFTFSLAVEIADLLDTGSSIVINKQESFHGFLTPDNVFLDMDGKIHLKNYGLFPYLGHPPELHQEMKKKYKGTLAPEYLRQEALTPQTDIYYMGSIIYRILTGDFYQYSPEEDFNAKIAAIEFTDNIPAAEDIDFKQQIQTLLSKTLNPDPFKRFSDIKELKDFISRHFHIEELSSATFILAYFMNLHYQEELESENAKIKEELKFTLPEEKKEVPPESPEKVKEHLAEEILNVLEEREKAKPKLIIPILVVIIVAIAIAVFLIIQQQKQAQKSQAERSEEIRQSLNEAMVSMRAELETEYQKKLKNIEEKAALTEEEKKAREDEIKQLKEWREAQEKRRETQIIQETKSLTPPKKETPKPTPTKTEPITIKPPEEKPQETPTTTEAIQKKPTETVQSSQTEKPKTTPTPVTPQVTASKLKEGDLISLEETTFRPSKFSGKKQLTADDLHYSDHLRKLYQGQQVAVHTELLISEKGKILDVKLPSYLKDEMSQKLSTYLKKEWEYIPAEKDKIKVKVWLPVKIDIIFPKL